MMLIPLNTALKIGVFSITSALVIQAFPVNAQEAKPRVQNRSVPALANLESRSFQEDPEEFFPHSQQGTLKYPEGTVGSRSQSDFEFLGQEFIVKMGETSHAEEDFDTYTRNEAQSDKVRVLLEVWEWQD